MNTLRPLIALIALSLTGAAHAALVLDNLQFNPLSGTTITPTADLHDFSDTKGLALSLGQLRATAPGTVVFDYYGKEAGQINELFVPALGADAIFSGQVNQWAPGLGSPLESSPPLEVAAGLLDFVVCTSCGDDVDLFGTCLLNRDAASLQAQWDHRPSHGYRKLGFHMLAPDHWLVFFDDCGSCEDDDFDDLIVGIRFTPVAEPGVLGLLGAGLLFLGMGGRRIKRRG
jgi:hypothetical protein